VIARHGLAPLLAAAQTGGPSSGWIALLTFQFTAEPFLPILGVLGLIGLFACLAERSYLLPIWLMVILIVQPRSAPTLAALPLAMLIGIALDRVVLPGIHGAVAGLARSAPPAPPPADAPGTPAYLHARTPRLFAAYCLIYALICAVSLPFTQTALRAVSPTDREAMAWVAANTPTSSAFLVLSQSRAADGWWGDSTGEWFPVLAQRNSLGTVQGSEWRPDGAFARSQSRFNALQTCVSKDRSCLEAWAQKGGVTFTHIYIARDRQGQGGVGADCCDPLVQSLRAAGGYRLVYDGPGALIFAH
jgi:hypothetical protein